MKRRGGFLRRLIPLTVSLILICFMLPGLSSAENPSWDCPNCGRKGNTGNFCGNCAQPKPKEIKAGDIVSFGCFEQDNNPENGQEAIEWIVLDVDKKDNKALLLSRYGLSKKPYNNKKTDITWEKCTLRYWLNNTFPNSAFTEKEQAAILTTKVDNSASQGYWNTNGGNNTKDKIFLLSYAEANRYLGVTDESHSNTKASVALTAYAVAHGAWTNDYVQTEDGKPAGWWWLRSPGESQISAASVLSDGSLASSDNVGNYDNGVVRPALWINLDSDVI